MRTKRAALLAIPLLLGLLLPKGASARTITALGSVSITHPDSTPATELVGVVVIHGPVFLQTITQQLPPFTAPVFVDEDRDDRTGHLVFSRFDTTVALTNTTTSAVNVLLTIRDASGAQLAAATRSVGSNATVLINLSALLP